MNKRVSVDGLTVEISKILDEYTDEQTHIVQDTIREVAEDTVKELKRTSPNGKRRARKYRNGWRVKHGKSRIGISSTVYNATNGQLTHLLENGHASRNGGRVSPSPSGGHIAPANDKAQSELVRKLKERLG